MRGYFGVGVEGLSKPFNAGNLFRSAQAFGAGFLFSIAGPYRARVASDTSRAGVNLPYYAVDTAADLRLPEGCRLVGVELTEDAVPLPSFPHPPRAAYVLGPERGALSADLLARCDHVVKIPTAFCINVSVAGAIVLYDRLISSGRFAERPLSQLGRPVEPAPHVHGGPRLKRPAAD